MNMKRSAGLGIIAWIAAIPILIVCVVIAIVVFYEARKAYWDHKVMEMCEKDGGVTVIQHVSIGKEEFTRLGGIGEELPIPNQNNLRKESDFPFAREEIRTKLHEWSPEVVRSESIFRRRSDGKILGRIIYYWRRGGDLPTGIAQASSFICPQETGLSKRIISVEDIPR